MGLLRTGGVQAPRGTSGHLGLETARAKGHEVSQARGQGRVLAGPEGPRYSKASGVGAGEKWWLCGRGHQRVNLSSLLKKKKFKS